MVDIPYIILELLFPGDGISAMALCPSGNTRPDFMATHLFGCIQRKVLDQQWSRPDERHVAFQDIDELGQLVDGCRTHETSDFGESVLVGQKISFGIPLIGHCLELDYSENLGIHTRPLLQEKHPGTFVGKMQPYGDRNQERQQTKQCDQRDDEIENALQVSFVHKIKW